MNCPFCQQFEIGDASGPTICPVCKTDFEIDERGECVFLNIDKPKISIEGLLCGACGLIQQEQQKSCVNCGIALNQTLN